MNIYEMHLGSWMRAPEDDDRWLNYRELAPRLVDHLQALQLHPRRAAAGGRAPPRPVLGVPGDRLLRPDQPPRHARRLQVPRRPAPPERHRRHHRLGAGALPQGRLRAALVRRDRALRARRPAPGRAPRLGHAHLQLRPPRGAELPPRQRALLAGRLPHRRAARGRGRLDALPRLQPQGGRVDARTVRRHARTSRRSTSSAR